jgi:phycocyanobilin lyase subunit beta
MSKLKARPLPPLSLSSRVTETKELIQAIEVADSSDRLLDAVRALAAACREDAIETLIEILGYNNPGAAVAAVDGLIALGEPAVRPLLDELDGYNYGARAWAIRALAGIGDPRALEILIETVETDFALSVRRAAAKGLGSIRWEKMNSLEVLENQLRAFKALLLATEDPEWVVRYAAVSGLESLAPETSSLQADLYQQILNRLNEIDRAEPELAVQTRARLAQKRLNQ